MNALELLRNDHTAVLGLLSDLDKIAADATRKKKMQMLNLIEREVKIHTALEEKIFYPAFRKAAKDGGDTELVHEAVEEHHLVDKVLPDLKILALKKDGFLAKLRVTERIVNEHIEREETEMFPRAQRILGAGALDRIGDRMSREKEKLYKSWTGLVRGPLHRGKSLVDKVTPLAAKELRVRARAKSKKASPSRKKK